MKKEEGFTLFELLVVIAITALLIGLAVPASKEINESLRRNGLKQQVESDVRYARSLALANGTRAVIRLTNGGLSYEIGLDEPPYNDPPAPDKAVIKRELESNFSLQFSDSIIFSSKGFSVDKDNDPTTISLSFFFESEKFCEGNIYAAGFLVMNCS
ncbi:MAG: prepilin-type N-terminal cleavage/methylation domain-containing protein [Candidatus Dadabacteria bacterium]|nr:MAG: prepilin-type N-terminal cleavage/methylation domain-containing protein [Candidatus Dadabacteria bacterium]